VLSLLSAERLGEHYRSGFWRHDTIYSLVAQHARRAPDHFALRDRTRRLDYRQLLAEVDELARDLDRRGVRPGQRVAVWPLRAACRNAGISRAMFATGS